MNPTSADASRPDGIPRATVAPRVGYACLALGVPGSEMRTCRLAQATPENLTRLTALNLAALRRLVTYNADNGIRLFRISSGLVPLGSHPVNTVPWWDIFREELVAIGELARQAGMRLSMHPGQYTILNAPSPDVVERSLADLAYHARVLDCLGTGTESRIVLHIGGVYGDRKQALARFREQAGRLDGSIRRRLAIENDERHFGIADALETGLATGLPVIFDNLHHAVWSRRQATGNAAADRPGGAADQLGAAADQNDGAADGSQARPWIEACRATWQPGDGRQKIHYSQQDPARKPGAHSVTVCVRPFLDFCGQLSDLDLDIMLEVKDKNLSALKCGLCLAPNRPFTALEREWSRYKYSVLERSAPDYLAIRELLKDKSVWPAARFYTHIEQALRQPERPGQALNAAQHVWGYFKDRCSDAERQAFLRQAAAYQAGSLPLGRLKRWLHRLAVQYEEPYLLASHYFTDLPAAASPACGD